MARPDLSYLKNMILFLFGLPLGMLTGLTAIASSVFAVPVVRFLLGLRPGRAVGTSLAVTFFAALASILSYSQRHFVDGALLLPLTLFQIIGAAWGERLAGRFPALERANWLWGSLVTAGGLAMMGNGLGVAGHAEWSGRLHQDPAFFVLAAAVALMVGAVSRVIGLGGVLLVPAEIYLLALTPHRAQGTALVVLMLASLLGMLIHARRGDVEPQGATWLSAGGVFGGLAGALWAAALLPDRILVVLFGLVTTVLGIAMLWRKDPAAAAQD